MKLNIHKDEFSPKFFPYLEDYRNRREVYMGSAGSAKSYFITQKLILKGLKSPRRILITRRYGTTIRHSAFSLFLEILKKWKIADLCHIAQSDMRINFPNGTQLIFLGLDNEEKLLSLSSITDIFIEEAFEITRDIYEQLELRMRAKVDDSQIFLAFNPISKKNWLYDYVTNPPESLLYIHSTYKDNPFLPQAYIDTIEQMEERNPSKFRIFGLGEWGVDPEGQVYTNYKIMEFDVLNMPSYEKRYGMDLGYVDPTTIVSTMYDKANGIIYIYDEYYKKGKELDEIAQDIHNKGLSRVKIHCDSAEPRTIKFFQTRGLRVTPAKKGAGSVESGIAFLQNNQIIVHPSCKNVINELENYVYLKDKKTGEYIEKTEHAYSHTLDALRYAYGDIYYSRTMSTMNKKSLGL